MKDNLPLTSTHSMLATKGDLYTILQQDFVLAVILNNYEI